jgi:hypothetical protein
VELLRVHMTGAPVRVDATSTTIPGVLGLDVARRDVDGLPYTVVQLLLDDDHPWFDPTLLDGAVVAELISDADGAVLAREPFDHDGFRRRLRAEQESGESTTRGILVLDDGELPPRWIRLAFLSIDLVRTVGATLVLRRTTFEDLADGVEAARARNEITAAERDGLLLTIDQHRPR